MEKCNVSSQKQVRNLGKITLASVTNCCEFFVITISIVIQLICAQ